MNNSFITQHGGNYTILYPALLKFRNAVLPFIVDRLKMSYRKGWWKAGVSRALGEKTANLLREQYKRRYERKFGVVDRPGDDISEMLDINNFLPIIQANWKGCFSDVLEQRDTVEVWLREIIEIRNVVAHPESGDITNEDTWRALDTMRRFLLPIDSSAAKYVGRLNQYVGGESTLPLHQLDLRDDTYNYEKGLQELSQVLLQEAGENSNEYNEFLQLRDDLIRILWDEKLSPNVEISDRKVEILRKLNQFTDGILRIPFTVFCFDEKPITESEASSQIWPLSGKIEELKLELHHKQIRKKAQHETGELVIHVLQKDIIALQKEIEFLENELALLKKHHSPQSYFILQRRLHPSRRNSEYFEEQHIDVSVKIVNKGSEPAYISYEENIPDGFDVLMGEISLKKNIEPGLTVMLEYSVCPLGEGIHSFSTKTLEYQNQIKEWDKSEDTRIIVIPSSDPELKIIRYYQYDIDKLKLFVSMNNVGDKTAHNIRYEENVHINNDEAVSLCWVGDIPGHDNYTEVFELGTVDPEKLSFDETTLVTYSTRDGFEISLSLEPAIQRIEYKFPVAHERKFRIAGRESELEYWSELVNDAWNTWHRGTPAIGMKNLLIVQGVEGSGKTRLILEYKHIAKNRGYSIIEVDAKNRSPLKGMLKLLLDMKEDEDDEEIIRKKLMEVYGSLSDPRLDIVFSFLSPVYSNFAEDEMRALQAYVIAIIRQLCEKKPTVLIFENIHWTPDEGIEEQILVKLFQNVLLSKTASPIMCATYRPSDTTIKNVVDKLNISKDYYETLKLKGISKDEIVGLVDEIIYFPRLSNDVLSFAVNWAGGNPLYLVELLRLITKPDSKYLVRVNHEWYPQHGIILDDVLPKRIEEVVLQRIEEDIPNEARLVEILSSIGFELPMALVLPMVERNIPNVTNIQLQYQLDVLVQAGILVFKGTQYEFEHQMKRDVIYDNLSERKQVQLRQQVAEILLARKVYDSDEQVRQLTRHIIKSPETFQREHLEHIKNAARLEIDKLNLPRAYEYTVKALSLVGKGSFEEVELLLERSKLHRLQGNWIAAEDDLNRAAQLVSHNSSLHQMKKNKASKLRNAIDKELGVILCTRSGETDLARADELLGRARVHLEGILPIRRLFPPKDEGFHRDLIEIYLSLAQIWLRKSDYKTCKKACRRAERIASSALKNWPEKPMIQDVYITVGDVHVKRGREIDLGHALDWYSKAEAFVREDSFKSGQILIRQAETYYALGDLELARNAYERAIKIQTKLKDLYGLAISYGGLGNIFVEQSEYEKGLYYCEQAYRYQDEIGDHERFWRTCLSLVKIHLNLKDVDKSLEYWSQVRIALIEQEIFRQLGYRKQQEIIALQREFISYSRRKRDFNELSIHLQDLSAFSAFIRFEELFDESEIVAVQIELGESYFEIKDWEKAVEVLGSILDVAKSPSVLAEIHERLGDIFIEYKPEINLISDLDWYGKPRSGSEIHYEESIGLFAQAKNNLKIIDVYTKLLNLLLVDKAGLTHFPLSYVRIIKKISELERVIDKVASETENKMLDNNFPVEAGDILVYTARIVEIPDLKKNEYLQRAEMRYRTEQNVDHIIWGLNMLIPSYYRLGLWDEIVRCFEELFELHVEMKKVDDYLDTFRVIGFFEDKINVAELDKIGELALSGLEYMSFSYEQEAQLYLTTAKNHLHISNKFSDDDTIIERQNLALEYYDKALELSSRYSTVILHDTSTIFTRRGNYNEALKRLGESIEIESRRGYYRNASQSRIHRASILTKLGRLDEAYSDFREGLGVLKSYAEKWDERIDATDEYELDIFGVGEMREDQNWYASGLLSYVEYCIARRETGHLGTAIFYAKQAESLFVKIGKPNRASVCQFLISTINTELGKRANFLDDSFTQSILLGNRNPLTEAVVETETCPTCGSPINFVDGHCSGCEQAFCPNCYAAIDSKVEVCPNCGSKITFICPSCDTELCVDDSKCPDCGETFNE